MKSAPWLVLLRAAALLALALSAALLADYSGSAPTYCAMGSGCAELRRAGFGSVPLTPNLFVPVPLLGVVAFALLLGVSLLPEPKLRERLTRFGALLGAAIGVALLALQAFVAGVFCAFCVMVDVSAIASGIFAALWARDGRPARELLSPFAWALLALIGFAAPFYWPKARPAPALPAEVAKLYQPGKINVVEFADFECPHCRRLHPRLKKLNAEFGDQVNFIRLNLPLGGHRNARPAAIAYVCADEQGHGEAMADFLFSVSSLGSGVEKEAAEKLGLDTGRFFRCLGSKAAAERVDREAKILLDAGFDGLPTTFVGGEKLIGAQSEETFRAAYERAKRGVDQSGAPAPLYWLAALIAAALVAWFGRLEGEAPEPAKKS